MQQVVTCSESELESALRLSKDVIKQEYGLDRESRLWIYRSMYPARMVEAMQVDFPGVLYALGREAFEELVMDYVEEHPSTSWTLNQLGHQFPAFLASHKSLRGRGFVSELAELELTLAKVFEEPEAPALQSERLQSLSADDWEYLLLKPRPTSKLLHFRYPVSSYLFRVDQGHEPRRPRRETQRILIMRRSYQMNRVVLSGAGHFLLQQLFAGRSLGQAIERLMRRHPEVEAPDLQRWFGQWGEWGIFLS